MQTCHLTFENLLDAYEGRGDAASTKQVQDHLAAGCPSCRHQWQWLQRVLAAAQEMDRVEVPEWPLARATALFRELYVRPTRPSWLARLLFDSGAQPQLALARGEPEPARHLLYTTEHYDIELWQEALTRTTYYLIGQVLPKQDAAAIRLQSVALTDAGGHSLSLAPEGGEFHLPSVPVGLYQVRLALEESDIYLADVTIGA